MTQPIDVAYVEILPDTKVFRSAARKEIGGELKNIEKDADKSTSHIADAFTQAGKSVGGVFRDINGRLHDEVTGRFVALEESGKKAFDGITESAGSAQEILAQIGRALGSAIPGALAKLASEGPVGISLLIAGFGALVIAISLAANALQGLVQIGLFGLATLPGLVLAAVSAFGILAAATHGIADAFKEQTQAAKKAGSAGVDMSRQIADAQRGVIQAQKDLNAARDKELKRIRDIEIAVTRARASELRASDNLLKAQIELARARAVGSPQEVKEAEIALAEAQAASQEAVANTADAVKEKADADKNGVEQSEQVLRAQEALRDAQDRLAASQQKVSAGAAAQNEAFKSLTKSAQAFVLALVGAQKQLGPVQDALQEAFFQGTAPLIQPIVDNIKELQPELTRVAAGFGNIFKELLSFLGSDTAKKALDQILTGLAEFLDAVTPAVKPLLEAFAGLAGDSGEFSKTLGGAIATGLTKLADFVKNVDLKQLFEDAKKAVNDWLPVIKELAVIALALGKTFADIGRFFLPGFTVQLEILGNFVKGVAIEIQFLVDWTIKLAESFGRLAKEIPSHIATAFTSVRATISAWGPKFFAWGKELILKLIGGLTTGDFSTNVGVAITNAIIKFVNNNIIANINRGIKAIQDSLNGLPFVNGVSLPQLGKIPALEKGGLTMGETIARIGEKGKQEAVLPLENSRAMKAVGDAIANASGGMNGSITFEAGAISITFEGVTPSHAEAMQVGRSVAAGITDTLRRRSVRTNVRAL